MPLVERHGDCVSGPATERSGSGLLSRRATASCRASSTARSSGARGWATSATGVACTARRSTARSNALRSTGRGLLVGGAFTNAGGTRTPTTSRAGTAERPGEALGASPLDRRASTRSPTAAARSTSAASSRTRAATRTPTSSRSGTAASWGPVCNATGPAIDGTVLRARRSSARRSTSAARSRTVPASPPPTTCSPATSTPARRGRPSATDGDIGGAGVRARPPTAAGASTRAAGSATSPASRPPTRSPTSTAAAGTRWAAGPGRAAARSTSFVRSLAASGTDVYVGTDSSTSPGSRRPTTSRSGTARPGARSARTPPARTAGSRRRRSSTRSTTSGSRVFAGGAFENANGDPLADHIAQFDGKTWQPVGSNGAGDGPFNGTINALADVRAAGSTPAEASRNAGGERARALRRLVPARRRAAGGGGGDDHDDARRRRPARRRPARATGTVLVNGRPFTSGTVPFGATVDVTRGRARRCRRHRHADGRRRRRHPGGVRARARHRPTGGRSSSCGSRGATSASARSARRAAPRAAPTTIVRQLWGDGKGSFRTRGRYAVGDRPRHELAHGRPLRRRRAERAARIAGARHPHASASPCRPPGDLREAVGRLGRRDLVHVRRRRPAARLVIQTTK